MANLSSIQIGDTTYEFKDSYTRMSLVQVAMGTIAITATVNTYYEVAGEVGELTVTLPIPTDTSKIYVIVIHLTAGSNPNVIFETSDDPQPDYSAAFDILAGKEYEISCMYNGDKWIVADMEVL